MTQETNVRTNVGPVYIIGVRILLRFKLRIDLEGSTPSIFYKVYVHNNYQKGG